jgi:drug/metabolite transporter (DMT)-like permease
MLEIFLLRFLCKKMGSTLRDKGWGTTFWMQLGVVVAWFGFMLVGAVGYTVYLVMTKGEAAAEHPDLLVLYPIAFLAAGSGVALLFGLVSLFPSHDLPRTWNITADSQ